MGEDGTGPAACAAMSVRPASPSPAQVLGACLASAVQTIPATGLWLHPSASGLILKILLFAQPSLQEGISFDDLVQALFKVFQGHDYGRLALSRLSLASSNSRMYFFSCSSMAFF